MISTGNREPLVKFYEDVFEKKVDEMMGWLVGNVYFGIMDHSEINGKSKEPARIMINIESDDVVADFDRISNIEGAEVVKKPYQMTMDGGTVNEGEETEDGFWIATLADPDGNYFQLMSPWSADDFKDNQTSN